MKYLQNKFNLSFLLICLSFYAAGQTVGSQIQGTLKTNGTQGQVDVYLKSDYASTATDNFTSITLAFAIPTASTTGTTKPKIVNSQIVSMPIGNFVLGTTRVVGSNTIYPFTASYTGTVANSFTAGVEFKIGTFEFNDYTLNMASVSLFDNPSGLPGSFVQFYIEMNNIEKDPSVRSNRFYAGTGGTLGNSVDATYGTGYYVTASTQILLPVTLVSFTAAKAGTGNNLNWLVSSETNAKQYDVERSSGNGAAFTAIGNVAANNNGKYSFTDASPLGGVNYYRLKMLDIDGQFKYSEVRSVLFDGTTVLFDIYPNPVITNNLYLHVQQYNYAGTAQAIVTDIAGRSLQTSTINLVKGNNQLPITVKGLTSGSYFVTVYDASGNVITETKKLVKQ